MLLSIKDYQRVLGKRVSIGDLLAMPSEGNIEMEIPVYKELARPADLS